jgi:hypothetical protein
MDFAVQVLVALVFFFTALGLLVMRAGLAGKIRMDGSPGMLFALLASLCLDVAVSMLAVSVISLTFVVPRPQLLYLADLMCLVMLFPYPFTRFVLVPLGAAQFAFDFARLSHWRFWNDRTAGGVAMAAWASLRSKKAETARLEQFLASSVAFYPDEGRGWAFLRRLLPRSRRVNALLAAGLLAAARDDFEGARALLKQIAREPLDGRDRTARALAVEWLCADGAERGDWREVMALSMGFSFPHTPLTLFLGCAALRIVGDERAPGEAELERAWRRSGCAAATAPLYERARGPRRRSVPSYVPSRADGGGDLGRALAGQLALSRGTPARPAAALVQVARAWERALEAPEMARALAGRASDLGVPTAVPVLDEVRAQVEEQLGAIALRDGVRLDDLEAGGALLARVGRRIRGEMLGQLDDAIQRITARVEDDRRLPGAVEMGELEALVEQYMAIGKFGGLETRGVAFASMHAPICAWAVWLFNERRQKRVGNAIFRFLWREAFILEDPAALELQSRNVRAGT